MHHILVFDLDGTLADLGKGMTEKNAERLKALEALGYRIAICSGKPTYYLCGFMRQIGLKEPILIGENGATFQFGVDLPPKCYFIYPHTKIAREQLSLLRARINEALGERIWYQPNEVALTPFPPNEECFAVIQKIIDSHSNDLNELAVYRHVDSFDIIPKNISKANGLSYLAEKIGMKANSFVAVGDGPNDLSMFAYADVAVGIGEKVKDAVDFTFQNIGDALNFFIERKI